MQKNKKNYNKKKFFSYLAVAFIVIVIFTVKLQRNYVSYVDFYSKGMYMPSSVGNPNLITAGPVNKIEKKSSDFVLSMKPGEVVNTKIYVRNGELRNNFVNVEFVELLCDEGPCKDYKKADSSWFKIHQLDQQGLVSLASNEIRFFDVEVRVPESIADGEYRASLRVHGNGSVQMKSPDGGIFNLVTANATNAIIKVAKNPEKLNYLEVLDDPKVLATNRVLIDLRIYASILLALVALLCVYNAYKKNK